MDPCKIGEMCKISNQLAVDSRSPILFLSIWWWICVAQFLVMTDGDDESIKTVNVTMVHGDKAYSPVSRSLSFNVQFLTLDRLVRRTKLVMFSKQKLTVFLSSPPILELSFSSFVSGLHMYYGEPKAIFTNNYNCQLPKIAMIHSKNYLKIDIATQ